MAVGSAVRSVRWEGSAGEESVEMGQAAIAVDEDMEGSDDDDDDGDDIEWEDEDGDGIIEDVPEEEVAAPKSRKTGNKKSVKEIPTNRVLPVAELPDDFEGEAMDGATFLALSNRVNATLPAFTRIPAPRTEPTYSPSQPVASSSRHPALPTESWTTAFPEHFLNYRNYIRSEWPPHPKVPYPKHLPPLPNARSRGDVWLYINGHRRKMLEVDADPKNKGKWKADTDTQKQEDAEWGIGAGDRIDEEIDIEVDEEEEAMNGPKRVIVKVQEEETEIHRTHEPLISVLQNYSSYELVSIIELITTFITETLDRLSPFVLVPSTPESSITPFPAIYSRWVFACLILLDESLDGQDMSSVRDLARCAMKVAAWRWIQAVTDKEVDVNEKASWNHKAEGERDKAENGLEETLGRCWMVVHAVAAGWGQRDLLEDLENMFK